MTGRRNLAAQRAMPLFVDVHNVSRPETPPLRVTYCATFLCRLRGLMFRREIGEEEALLLVQGRESRLDAAIHMIAVGMELAVIWINGEGIVVDKVLARPWHPVYIPQAPARYILECHPHHWEHFHIGDKIRFEHD